MCYQCQVSLEVKNRTYESNGMQYTEEEYYCPICGHIENVIMLDIREV